VNYFFDTNVLLDHFLGRKNSFAASQLIDWVLKNKIQGTLASISITNTWYILQSGHKKKQVEEDIQFLVDLFAIEGCTKDIFEHALGLGYKDLEDAIQFSAARKAKCDYIITANKRDFKKSSIPVINSSEAVDLIRALI